MHYPLLLCLSQNPNSLKKSKLFCHNAMYGAYVKAKNPAVADRVSIFKRNLINWSCC